MDNLSHVMKAMDEATGKPRLCPLCSQPEDGTAIACTPAGHVHKPEPEEIQVCLDCGEEAVNMGEDGISVCEGCGICEGRTKYITVEEYEANQ